MLRQPPGSTRSATLVPYTTLCRSAAAASATCPASAPASTTLRSRWCCGSCVAAAKGRCRCGEAPLTPRQPGIGHDRGNCPPTTGVPTMNPTHTDNLKSNLGEASDHLKQAAGHASDAFRSAASVAGDEARLGKAQVKADLADSALSGIAAMEEGAGAAREQGDQLPVQGQGPVDGAADLMG